jgi:benzil reductase ((S)-benzoin forming)
MKKTFIITGVNRGLGKGFVDVLIQDKDCFIIAISRSLTKEQKEYSSKRFYFLEMDLSEDNITEKIDGLMELIKTEAIYFINNANIIGDIKKIEDVEESVIDSVLSVNIKSTIIITQYLLKNCHQHKISFVNISSGAANRAISNWSLYCSSKAFVQMFFNVAESEYTQHRFFNIDPGVMDTNMQKSLRESIFPDLQNFRNLEKEGKLMSPIVVSQDILKTIEKRG